MTAETTSTSDVKIPLAPPHKADTAGASLSEKDAAFREFVLHENMWRVVFYVCTPLALYQSLNPVSYTHLKSDNFAVTGPLCHQKAVRKCLDPRL